MDNVTTSLVIGLVFGLGLASAAVWTIMRKSADLAASRAKGEAQVEIAKLGERLASADRDCAELRRRVEVAQATIFDLQHQAQALSDERARFGERASQVPDLEEKLKLTAQENEELKGQAAGLREQVGRAESTTEAQGAQIKALEGQITELATKRDLLLGEQTALKTRLGELGTSLEAERKQSAEKLALLSEAKEQLSASFRSLANDILEEKSQKFTDQNKANIDQILGPLNTKIQEFQGKVEQFYVSEGQDRSALKEQVKQLMSLNQQLSQDANNLATALKGSSKAQGNWGEMILERVLENAGLVKDREYLIRPTYYRIDGTRAQPDAVILLPESRDLVVDAKVSLIAYEEHTAATTDVARAAALQRHVASVRAHINSLSLSDYQSLPELKSLDFVVMFVPIEPAFMLAIASDSKLWQEAWQKNVLLVSPSTLLFVVRTVANLWRQELQKRSVQDIVKRGAELYDKLVGFVEDFTRVGEQIDKAKESYGSAYAKFHTGRGNAIRQAELLKGLGVKPTKSLPSDLVEASNETLALPPSPEGAPTTDG
jgi:DNA recombination protein RmuC